MKKDPEKGRVIQGMTFFLSKTKKKLGWAI